MDKRKISLDIAEKIIQSTGNAPPVAPPAAPQSVTTGTRITRRQLDPTSPAMPRIPAYVPAFSSSYVTPAVIKSPALTQKELTAQKIQRMSALLPHFGAHVAPRHMEAFSALIEEFQTAKMTEHLDSGSRMQRHAKACAGRDLCVLLLSAFGPYLEDYPELLPKRDILRQKLRGYEEQITHMNMEVSE